MLDAKEVSQLVSVVNDLRTAGKRGQLQTETPPDDESIKGTSFETFFTYCVLLNMRCEFDADGRIEPIPLALLYIIERLVSKQTLPVKPDGCIIDIFNEGDHSQPHMFAPWFARPVGILTLSECDFTFGRVIVSDHPGDYKGSLKHLLYA
ncbi:unnamed protein product [Cochlearia groenlandica]